MGPLTAPRTHEQYIYLRATANSSQLYAILACIAKAPGSGEQSKRDTPVQGHGSAFTDAIVNLLLCLGRAFIILNHRHIVNNRFPIA